MKIILTAYFDTPFKADFEFDLPEKQSEVISKTVNIIGAVLEAITKIGGTFSDTGDSSKPES